MRPLADRYSDANPATVNDEPSLTDIEVADKTRFVGAYAVTGDKAEKAALVRALLAARVPVVIESFVDSAYERLGSGVVVDHCDQHDPKGGGHCEVILAYKTAADGSTLFLVRNSWSRFWGDDGSVWVTERFLDEAWALYAVDVRRVS